MRVYMFEDSTRIGSLFVCVNCLGVWSLDTFWPCIGAASGLLAVHQRLLTNSKSTENEVAPEDTFSNLKISCVSEPIDYEQYLLRYKASIMNDPHRDLVLFPSDDVKIVRLQRTLPSAVDDAPPSTSIAELTKSSALARHVEATCSPPMWCLVREPFMRFRGAFCDLPKSPRVLELMGEPSEQWYAIDHVVEGSEDNAFAVRSKATAAANRSSAGGGSTANGSAGGASRLWTSARRPALEIVRGGEGGSNGTARSIDVVKISNLVG
ncbi:Dedicator of cytokinesi protein 9 [Taenia crassiceps]|uniref:Dedicator of cytokinesi protein 9 n=1 Tax=Taenia crassiceps TaxID=6207 RepID=A0ABR4Q6N8_9CEST